MVCYIIYDEWFKIPVGYEVNGKQHYFMNRLGLEHPDGLPEDEWSNY